MSFTVITSIGTGRSTSERGFVKREPTTTMADNDSPSSIFTLIVDCSPTVISWVLKPTKEKTKMSLFSAFTLKLPSTSVNVPFPVPFTKTLTPTSASPLPSVMVPEIDFSTVVVVLIEKIGVVVAEIFAFETVKRRATKSKLVK